MVTLLSGASGFVDSLIFLGIQRVFVANQSGNLIIAGIAAGRGQAHEALAPAVSVGAYVAGSALAVGMFDAARQGRRRFLAALLGEALVLCALAVTAALTGVHPSDQPGADAYLLLSLVGLAAASQGMQSVALRSVGPFGVLTTGETGNLTSVGSLLGRTWRRRTRAVAGRGLRVVGGAVLAYLTGAAVAATALRAGGSTAPLLTVPIAAIAVATAIQLAAGRRRRT